MKRFLTDKELLFYLENDDLSEASFLSDKSDKDADVLQEEKVHCLYDSSRNQCCELALETNLFVDEQMVPNKY